MVELVKEALPYAEEALRDLNAALRLEPGEFPGQRGVLLRRSLENLIAAQLLGLGAARKEELREVVELLRRDPEAFSLRIALPRIALKTLERLLEFFAKAGDAFKSGNGSDTADVSAGRLCEEARLAALMAQSVPSRVEDWMDLHLELSSIPVFLDTLLGSTTGDKVLQKSHDVFRFLAWYCMLTDVFAATAATYQSLGPETIGPPSEEDREAVEDLLKTKMLINDFLCTYDLLRGCQDGCRCGMAGGACTHFCSILICTNKVGTGRA